MKNYSKYTTQSDLYSIPLAETNKPQAFHFSHGDLSGANIFLDPQTGGVTGIIDWEMSGSVQHGSTTMIPVNSQWKIIDTRLQMTIESFYNTFTAFLVEENLELLQHYEQNAELRAIFYNLCHQYPSDIQV